MAFFLVTPVQAQNCAAGSQASYCINPAKEYLGGLAVPKFDLTPGARNIGMGRAGSTLISDPVLARLNPAALAKNKMFSISAGYQRNADGSDQYNLGLSDSSTTALAASLYYSMEADAGFGFIGSDIRPPKYSYLSFAIADDFPVMEFPIMMGAAVNWLRTDLPTEPGSDNVVDGTFGAYMAPMKDLWNLSAGVVGRNLVGTDKERLARMVEMTGGIAPLSWLRGGGGVVSDLTRSDDLAAGFVAGLEIEPIKELLIRGGGVRDPAIRDYLITAGIGFENLTVSVAFAYQRNMDRKANQYTFEFAFREFAKGAKVGNYPPNQGPKFSDPPKFK